MSNFTVQKKEDQAKNKLHCNEGLWKLPQNVSLNLDRNVGNEPHQDWPKCREIVCKRRLFILNSRLLKQVG